MFFNKEKLPPDPFEDFDKKRTVYYDFFRCGVAAGFDMFLASREKNYLGGLKFKDPIFFNGKNFEKTKKTIIADAIYDRSGGLKFPSKKISPKVLNSITFKSLCYSKNKMYRHIGDFMPKSFKIKNQKDFENKIKFFPKNELVVIKPSAGLGGKGIIIDTPSHILASNFIIKKESVLQKFVDTSSGIKGITKGRHDLRIVIVNGKIIYACLRTPKNNTYLANVAQGGKIQEIPLSKLSPIIKRCIVKIKKVLDKKFNFPIYSIDFGIEKEKPFVFELNDQIGFPSAYMKSYPLFTKTLIQSLGKLAYKTNP